MVLTVFTVMLICALICFLLDAFRVSAAVSWWPLGWAFIVMAVLFGGRPL
jgi:hypothetical protein